MRRQDLKRVETLQQRGPAAALGQLEMGMAIYANEGPVRSIAHRHSASRPPVIMKSCRRRNPDKSRGPGTELALSPFCLGLP